jgi:HlyD family secretion protein
VSDGVVSYRAVISVPNDKGMLRPGMTATADIAVADALDVLSVPNTALRYAPAGVSDAADAGPHVYVLTDGKLRQVAVTTGLSDGQRTEITTGLDVGDVVVTGNKVR